MAHRDTIVVGASMGGLEALPRLVGTLPARLNAAWLVVQHLHEGSPNHLPCMLNRMARIPFAAAVNGERIEPGRGYVAQPGRHLMIQDGRIRLSRGPKESHARPSVDVLFRSAAYELSRRVIGIVLTGTLDDGTAGLWAIKDRGGVAIVQSPEDARYPSMPQSALRHVQVDYALPIAEMGATLARLVTEQPAVEERLPLDRENMKTEVRIALGKRARAPEFAKLGVPSFCSCPQCLGSMVRISEGFNRRYRCHAGHAFGEACLVTRAAPEGARRARARLREIPLEPSSAGSDD